VGALGLSVTLVSARPWLIALALILLSVGFFQLYRRQRSCQRCSRLSLVLFEVSAVIVLAVIAFPQRVAEVIASFL
jgi:hypothetical protein